MKACSFFFFFFLSLRQLHTTSHPRTPARNLHVPALRYRSKERGGDETKREDRRGEEGRRRRRRGGDGRGMALPVVLHDRSTDISNTILSSASGTMAPWHRGTPGRECRLPTMGNLCC